MSTQSGATLTSLFNYHWASGTHRDQDSLDPGVICSSQRLQLPPENLLPWNNFKNWEKDKLNFLKEFWRRRKGLYGQMVIKAGREYLWVSGPDKCLRGVPVDRDHYQSMRSLLTAGESISGDAWYTPLDKTPEWGNVHDLLEGNHGNIHLKYSQLWFCLGSMYSFNVRCWTHKPLHSANNLVHVQKENNVTALYTQWNRGNWSWTINGY